MGGYTPTVLCEHSRTAEKGSDRGCKPSELLHPPPTTSQAKRAWWNHGEEVPVGVDSRPQPQYKEEGALRVNSSASSQTELSLNLDRNRATDLEARDLKVHSRERGRCLFTAHSTVSAPQKSPRLAGCSRRKVAMSTAHTGGGEDCFSRVEGVPPQGEPGIPRPSQVSHIYSCSSFNVND